MGEFEDLDTRFLTKAEAERLARRIKQFEQVAGANHGWIADAEYEAVAGPLVKKALAGRQAFDAMLGTRVGQSGPRARDPRARGAKNGAPRRRGSAASSISPTCCSSSRTSAGRNGGAGRASRACCSACARRSSRSTAGPWASCRTTSGACPSSSSRRARPTTGTVRAEGARRRQHRGALRTEAPERLVLHHDCAPATLLHEAHPPAHPRERARASHDLRAELLVPRRRRRVVRREPPGRGRPGRAPPVGDRAASRATTSRAGGFLGPLAILNGDAAREADPAPEAARAHAAGSRKIARRHRRRRERSGWSTRRGGS